MEKLLLSLAVALALLTGCAGQSVPQASSSATSPSSGSNLQFYGTIDTGIGTGKTWR